MTTGTVTGREIKSARLSTMQPDLERRVHAPEAVGIVAGQMLVDKKSGTTTDHPMLRAAQAQARESDVLVVRTFNRSGRMVPEPASAAGVMPVAVV